MSARRVGLVAGGDGAPALGCALLAGMMRARRARAGVLAVLPDGRHGAVARGSIPALPAARRLAGSLSLREVPARPCGRLVVVRLDEDPAHALAQARRIDAAAPEAPVVTVVHGPRSASTDALLGTHDTTVVVLPADAPAALDDLARAERGVRVVSAGVPALAKALAVTGIPVLPAIRRLGHELGAGGKDGGRQSGQALLVMLGALLMTVLLAVAVGAVAAGLGRRSDHQRAADLAALAAARLMAEDFAAVVLPVGDGHGRAAAPAARGALDRATYLARARAIARATARRNDADGVRVSFPATGTGAGDLPMRVAVTVTDGLELPGGRVAAGARAEAEVVPPGAAVLPGGGAGAGEYTGPLEHRDGKPMRPDVARAYDRMAAAARADGVGLLVLSGFRSDAEQAVLFARHPDPRWVAPPGRSLHRLGTELDIGPASAYRWLARHAKRFGFVQRYSWEPWHYGYTRNAGSASVGFGGRRARGAADGGAGTVLPAWVPARYRPVIARAAQRWNVGAVLLAAQLQVESGFDPAARSSAGAQGIAQFMPATARLMGLADPWDAAAAIDAQAHLMRDLLRTFGAVPLALAAYNAGEGAVARCRCAGPYPETRTYVAKILALVLGTGDIAGLGAAQMTVRLVR